MTWQVKDYADGWTDFTRGEDALREVAAMGEALVRFTPPAKRCLGDGAGYGTASAMANSGRPVEIIFSPPTEEEGEPISSRSQPFLAGQTDAKPSAAGDEP